MGEDKKGKKERTKNMVGERETVRQQEGRERGRKEEKFREILGAVNRCSSDF